METNNYSLTCRKKEIPPSEIEEIRFERVVKKSTLKQISFKFGHSLSTIWKICNGFESVACEIQLTDSDREQIVSDIRSMAQSGSTYIDIRKKYSKISSSVIESIVRNRTFIDNEYSVPERCSVKNKHFTDEDIQSIRKRLDSGEGVYDVVPDYKHTKIANLAGVIRAIGKREKFKKVPEL